MERLVIFHNELQMPNTHHGYLTTPSIGQLPSQNLRIKSGLSHNVCMGCMVVILLGVVMFKAIVLILKQCGDACDIPQ